MSDLGEHEESKVIIRALRLNTLSKLSYKDSRQFDALLEDIFPDVELENFENESLAAACREACVDLKLEVDEKQIKKMIELDEQLRQRMGVVIVGPSGSGKSTIANVLTGGQALTSGEAFVDGELVTTRPNRRQRRHRAEVGVVFQDPRGSLNPRRSVGSQIAEPLRVHTDLRTRQIEARVIELLTDVQLPADFAERYPHELSGGQRQRVAIARALALRPKLLIADEPTSALDVSVQRGVLRLLADLHEVREFACLFISHDLAVVEQLASSVVVLRDGRIVEEGSSRQVLTDPQQPYTRELIESAPVPDPAVQAARRAARLAA